MSGGTPSFGARRPSGHLTKLGFHLLPVMFVLAILGVRPLQGQDSTGDGTRSPRGFINSVASTLYALAWPSAEYDSVTFLGARPGANGTTEIVAKLHGRSRWSDGYLWTEVILDIGNAGVENLRWGRNNAILAAPGETVTALGKVLEELTEELSAPTSPFLNQPLGRRASPTASPFVVQNACDRPVRLAIAYRSPGGEGLSNGWWRLAASSRRTLTFTQGRPLSSDAVWYFYAETTDGSGLVWEGETSVAVGDRTVQMKRRVDREGSYDLSLTCP